MTNSAKPATWQPMILVVGKLDEMLSRLLMLGIYACAREHGWKIISEHANLHHLERWIEKWQPRAVLTTFSSPATVARAAAMVPTAGAMCYTEGVAVPCIDVDHELLGRAAAEHLLGLKLRHFAVLGNWRRRWAAELRRAFYSRIRREGFDCTVSGGRELGHHALRSADPSRTALGRWIASLPKPTGIFTCCDPWGRELANHCLAVGVRVPEDASIVSANNDPVTCEMTEPPLSSVAINWQQIGYDAAMLAGRLAEGRKVEPVRRLVGPAGMVVRQSSDLIAVDDPDVAAALRLIRAHADRPMAVSDLLRRIPVARHRLERRFRSLVGRRILQEVRRVHIEQAKRILVATDLLMPEVAARSGFANATMLSLAFRQETGTTPSAFRQQFRLRG